MGTGGWHHGPHMSWAPRAEEEEEDEAEEEEEGEAAVAAEEEKAVASAPSVKVGLAPHASPNPTDQAPWSTPVWVPGDSRGNWHRRCLSPAPHSPLQAGCRLSCKLRAGPVAPSQAPGSPHLCPGPSACPSLWRAGSHGSLSSPWDAPPRSSPVSDISEHRQPGAVAAERAWTVRAGTARPRPTWHQPSLPIWQVGSSSQASRPYGTPCLRAAPDPGTKGQALRLWELGVVFSLFLAHGGAGQGGGGAGRQLTCMSLLVLS